MVGDFVWIVGGSIFQLPMLEEVRRRGLRAVVTDGSDKCFLADRITAADKMVVVSTYDIRGHINLANAFALDADMNVRAVVAPGADVGPTASAVAEVLGLRAVPLQVALDTRNKAAMRLKTYYDHPKADVFFSNTETNFRWWQDSLPCVIKPVDNCGTRGMSVAYNREGFLAGVETALKSNKDASGVVVEEMMTPNGAEVSLDFLIIDGEAVWTNGCNRLFRHHLPGSRDFLFGIEGAVVNPFGPHSKEWENLGEMATETAHRLGVTEGPFKFDCIRDKRYGWVMLECATRWSGGYDHMFMAPMVGRDLTSVLLDYALGLETVIPPVLPNRYCSAYMPYYPPQLVKRWEWLLSKNQLYEQYRVKYVFLRGGDEIKPLKTCADRVSWFMAEGDTWLGALRNAYRGSKFVVPIPEDMNGHSRG